MYLCDNMIFFYRFVNGYAENLSNICSFSCTASVYSCKCEGEFSFLAHLSGDLHQVKYLFICRTKVSMLIIEIAQITCKSKRPTLKNMPRHNRASVLWSVLTFHQLIVNDFPHSYMYLFAIVLVVKQDFVACMCSLFNPLFFVGHFGCFHLLQHYRR